MTVASGSKIGWKENGNVLDLFLFAFRTKHREQVCKREKKVHGEGIIERRKKEGKLVEHEPEGGGGKWGQGHQWRFREEREYLFLGGGAKVLKRNWIKIKLQGVWGTKIYDSLELLSETASAQELGKRSGGFSAELGIRQVGGVGEQEGEKTEGGCCFSSSGHRL